MKEIDEKNIAVGGDVPFDMNEQEMLQRNAVREEIERTYADESACANLANLLTDRIHPIDDTYEIAQLFDKGNEISVYINKITRRVGVDIVSVSNNVGLHSKSYFTKGDKSANIIADAIALKLGF